MSEQTRTNSDPWLSNPLAWRKRTLLWRTYQLAVFLPCAMSAIYHSPGWIPGIFYRDLLLEPWVPSMGPGGIVLFILGPYAIAFGVCPLSVSWPSWSRLPIAAVVLSLPVTIWVESGLMAGELDFLALFLFANGALALIGAKRLQRMFGSQ